jgi:hypothetical protein
LSNSFQQVYSQQKFKKGVIERYKEMQIQNELGNADQEKNSIVDDRITNKDLNEKDKRNSIRFA